MSKYRVISTELKKLCLEKEILRDSKHAVGENKDKIGKAWYLSMRVLRLRPIFQNKNISFLLFMERCKKYVLLFPMWCM